ncbi:MAG: hypothetical protein ACREDE_07905 [Thermoplasmata archaeon]
MDGRWYTLILLFGIPAVGIAATIAWFSANPLAIFVALGAIVLGSLYLLTYTETFA